MKKTAWQKNLRIIIAIPVLLFFTFLFVDIGSWNGEPVSTLAKWQIVPLALRIPEVNAIICLILVLIVTLLFGRLYCSVLCPLGLLQDAVRRIPLFGKKKKRRYKYTKPHNVLRYVILGLTVLVWIFGSISLLTLLDPYSNFGRIVENVFRPVYIGANNALAWVFQHFNNYTFYYSGIDTFHKFSFFFALGVLLLVAFLAYRKGRLFCNSLCPVGTFLGLISRFSFFKVRLNPDTCTHCGICGSRCKSNCINTKTAEVDASRCVACFNCLGTCKFGAISYSFGLGSKKSKVEKSVEKENVVKADTVNQRRVVLSSLFVLAASKLAFAKPSSDVMLDTDDNDDEPGFKKRNISQRTYTKKNPITPPGSLGIVHFMDKCTACHLCVSQCPTQVLQPAKLEFGWEGMFKPRMDFIKSFCNFECTICTDVCPTGALQKLTIEEKRVTQMGKAVFVRRNCVVNTDGTDCGACDEHCPTKAISMVPFREHLLIPQVDQSKCVGCGGCEYICPVRPYRAIYVEGNPIHLAAQKIEEDEQQVLEVDDFGF